MADRQGASDKSTSNATAARPAVNPEQTSSGIEADSGILGMQHAIGNRVVAQIIGSGRSSLIVEDDAAEVDPGQERKSEFLAQLRADVCATTDDALAGTGRTSAGCPYIERWIDQSAGKPAAQVERGIRIFAPEAARAETASELIAAAAARVRSSTAKWAQTGEVDGMNGIEENLSMSEGLPGGMATALLFKAREGGAQPDDPRAVLHGLGRGEVLGGEARSRMESAFGRNFGGVRLHTGPRASSLASGMNARAFTLGEHVAFGAGEYRPGTPEGDALLAHELAHVAQQSSVSSSGIQQKGTGPEDALERDADSSAVSAVVSLWTGRRLSALPSRALPRLKSGLRLQRCSHSPKRYEWQDQKLHKLVDSDIQGAAEIRTYVDSLGDADRNRAMNDLQRGRVDYIGFRKTLDKDSSAVTDLNEAIEKMDDVLNGIYRDTLKNKAPGVSAPLTEVALGTAPAALSVGTHALTDDQRTAIGHALSPTVEIDPNTGKAPDFKPSVAGVKYEVRLEKALRDGIASQFARIGAGKGALHTNAANLHAWSVLENIGNESRKQVDSVFGSYSKRPAFVAGTNLLDRWDQEEAHIGAETDVQKLETAKWRVLKVFKDDSTVAQINDEHKFIPGRALEQGLADAVVLNLASDPTLQPQLLEIHKGWPGSQTEDPVTHQRQVSLQRFKSPDDDKNRAFAWRTFQMLIHEYIHATTHSRYTAFVNTLPDLKAHTLREGMTDAFTKVVWSNVQITNALRVAVEGPYHDPAVVQPVPELHVYPATRNAEQVIAIVGIDNAANAYFLGKTELIGKV